MMNYTKNTRIELPSAKFLQPQYGFVSKLGEYQAIALTDHHVCTVKNDDCSVILGITPLDRTTNDQVPWHIGLTPYFRPGTRLLMAAADQKVAVLGDNAKVVVYDVATRELYCLDAHYFDSFQTDVVISVSRQFFTLVSGDRSKMLLRISL